MYIESILSELLLSSILIKLSILFSEEYRFSEHTNKFRSVKKPIPRESINIIIYTSRFNWSFRIKLRFSKIL